MKTGWILVVGLFLVAVISCQCLRPKSDRMKVQIGEHAILIPGTAISGTDQEALNKIFRKYDNSLYRIAVYENGGLKKRLGKMDEIQIADITEEYTRHATTIGLTSWIFQLGARTHVTHYPPTVRVNRPGNPSHVTTGEPTHVTTGETTHVTTGEPTHVTTGEPTHVTHHDYASLDQEADALVKEVTPILEKYSK